MTRDDWQEIAEERLIAARTLLDAHNWASAYYLVGYAIECGLKSCILARVAVNPVLIFLDKRYSEKCWTHDIEELVKLAGLEAARTTDATSNPELGKNWATATSWNEKSRYLMKTQADAQSLYDAITDAANGVMQWIRIRW